MFVSEEAALSVFDQTRLAELESTYAPRSLSREDLLADRLLLATHESYHVYFGPIGAWPLAETQVIFVGLTPGFTQLQAAARLFIESSESVRTDEVAYSALLRSHVSFAGTMRQNLCRMLDELGVREKFNIERSDELFESQSVAATSALVMPVFKAPNLDNFSGVSDLSKISLFREMLMVLLPPRLRRAPNALIVPFGLATESGIRYLVKKGNIEESRVLTGFPHPSGANGHRKRLFESNRERLRAQLKAWSTRTVNG